MPKKYNHLLSPIKVGNIVFKNRLVALRGTSPYIQGSELYPTEALITCYANKAKNGAALVLCGGVGMPHVIPDSVLHSYNVNTILPGSFDIYNNQCQYYISQLAEAIHLYNAKASMQIGAYVPIEYDVSNGIPSVAPMSTVTPRIGKEIPSDVLEEVATDFIRQATLMKIMGFDMVYLHMAYRLTILGRFLSPLTNKRTDAFGGSLENMARFPIMVADRIKDRCGSDFLVEASISGVEPEGGRTLEQTVELAKLLSGHFDILQIRSGQMDPAHPTGFDLNQTPFLRAAEAVKKSGVNIAVETVGGYQDLDICEDVIESGKADFVGMARNWISNNDYGRMAYEGRNEDVVPCIRCNRCFRSSYAEPPISVCSVNPIWGLEHKIGRMIEPSTRKKKVAVIGGGPAGMKAALVATERGHNVTLYEKNPVLGGLLNVNNDISFKWPVRNLTKYLVNQITKANIKVLLNTEATPEMLRKVDYDALIVAVGSEPLVLQIPGVDGSNVISALSVCGNEDTLANNIVVIGGGEVGVEIGMHLAEKGHAVTVIEKDSRLAKNAPPIHFYDMFREAWEKLPNFNYIVNALCTRIEADKVIYLDANSREQEIKAGSIVLAVGMKAKRDLALGFQNASGRFYMIGDCEKTGNVQKAIRSAFFTASML